MKDAIPAIGLAGLDAEAMKLTPRGRAEVVDARWLSADSKEEVDAAWDAEMARRIRQIDSGEVECISLGGRDGGNARQVRLMQIVVCPARD